MHDLDYTIANAVYEATPDLGLRNGFDAYEFAVWRYMREKFFIKRMFKC